MDSAWFVSLRVPQVPSIKHRSSRCSRVPAAPCSSACSLAETRLGAPRRRFPRGCSGQRAELPSRRCGSRSRVGPKHFRCPRQRSSTVSVRPTHLPDTAAEGQWPIKRIFHAPSALYLQQIFQGPGHSGSVLNPVPPSQTSPWATASMPTSSTNGFACRLSRKPRLSSQRSSRCLLKCSARVRMLKRAAAIMSLIQSARNNGHDPYAYLKDVLTRLPAQRASEIAELLPHRWHPA